MAYYVAYSATGKSEVQFELAGPNSCYGWALVGWIPNMLENVIMDACIFFYVQIWCCCKN